MNELGALNEVITTTDLAEAIMTVDAEVEDSGHPMTMQTAKRLAYLAVKLAERVLAERHSQPFSGP
jgi:hypothetical protein